MRSCGYYGRRSSSGSAGASNVMPVVSRFGSSAPSAHRFIEELPKQSGEDIVSSGATTANALGLTTLVPVQMVYWTPGRSWKLNLGKLVLHLEHVASWQRVLAKEPAGVIVRVLAWAQSMFIWC
jgi:hypothetical protein